ncbi:putative copper chaperone CopZ [Staphylococcus lugdunensis]|jgi:copper chaperone|uniref:Copper chaperone CopZ n=2 Tax=Staphylococcus lugdunensis TaxID=28035 RepID=A0ABD4EFK1_STALU|nr:heavy metal-associated domain protein [Staphylococcus lugdunensis M23590]KXA38393.1 putative copper chaperone CopZ [Staphylococcus lugdunensis]
MVKNIIIRVNTKYKKCGGLNMKIDTLNVEGMSCEHCRNAVESALAKLNGVSSAEVDLDKGQVRVGYSEDKVTIAQMKDAIEDQGYDVK